MCFRVYALATFSMAPILIRKSNSFRFDVYELRGFGPFIVIHAVLVVLVVLVVVVVVVVDVAVVDGWLFIAQGSCPHNVYIGQ